MSAIVIDEDKEGSDSEIYLHISSVYMSAKYY